MAEGSILGEWVKQRRKALDLTQVGLARLANCAVITIQKIEAGERRPSKQIAEKLAGCLAIPAAQRAAFLAAARDKAASGVERAPEWPVALPAPATPLLGRDSALNEIAARLRTRDVRLLTLVGPPGIGKTRLAIAAAAEVALAFAGDVVFVSLQAIEDAGLALPTIAGALELREAGDTPVLQRLQAALHTRRLLLVLDNLEQVIAAARDIAGLLAECPDLCVLATSRIALHVRGEHLHPVAPLAVPSSTPLPLAKLSSLGAVELFVDRAQAIVPDFALVAENAPTVAAICARLEGVPLAIELAAARLKVLALPALLARLEQQLPLLTHGQRDLPERQQTLRRAIEWSYLLLPAAARTVMQHMAVCRGGCTDEAVAALLDLAPTDPAVLDALVALVDHSLARRAIGESALPRFTMLASIREYAVEQLQAHGDPAAIQAHHAHYFLRLAEQAEPELKGPDQAQWLARLADEHDNFRAALEWAWQHEEQEIGLRIAGALAWFWFVRGHYGEGRRWLERLLGSPHDDQPPYVLALALRGAGLLCHGQGDYARARAYFERSLAIYRRHDDARLIALVCNNLGLVAFKQQLYDDARAAYTESLAQFRTLDDLYGVASTQNNLGNLAAEQEDNPTALACYTESLACYRAIGHTRGIASVLGNSGDIAMYAGDLQRAQAAYIESIAMYRTLGDQLNLAVALANLAGLGMRARHPESVRRGARLYGAAETLREEIGAPQPPQDVEYEQQQIDGAAGILPPEEFAHAWEEGASWSLDDTLAYAVTPDENIR